MEWVAEAYPRQYWKRGLNELFVRGTTLIDSYRSLGAAEQRRNFLRRFGFRRGRNVGEEGDRSAPLMIFLL